MIRQVAFPPLRAGENEVYVSVRDARTGLLRATRFRNHRTAAGAAWLAALLASAAGVPAKYVCLTSDTTPVSNSDGNTLASELTANGLARTAGSFAANAQATLDAATTCTVTSVFTYTGSTLVSVGKVGLSTSATIGSGVMPYSNVLPTAQTVNNNGDVLTVVWTLGF